MIQTGFKRNGVVDFVKNHLSTIILIPAFVGGIWQLIELMSISMPYIRFFSISQIVPDGLLILMFLSFVGISTMLPAFLDAILPKKKDRSNEVVVASETKLKRENKKNITFILFYFFVFYGLGIAYFTYLYQFFQSKSSLNLHASMALVICLICNALLIKCSNLLAISNKENLKLFNIPLLALYMLIGYFFCQRIHNTFLLTDNLDNIENVQCVLKQKYPHSKNEILYFNDKYIFIDVTDTLKLDQKTKKPREKIHIMELEKLFND